MYKIVGADGRVYGPVDVRTLQQWCQEGRILPGSQLIDEATGQTLTAQQLPQLGGHFSLTATQSQVGAPFSGQFGMPPASQPYARYPSGTGGPPPKTKVVAILLAIFLGGFGVHRFYLGHIGSGVAMLLLFLGISLVTCGLFGFVVWIWAWIDVILISTDSLRDANGQYLA